MAQGWIGIFPAGMPIPDDDIRSGVAADSALHHLPPADQGTGVKYVIDVR
jgi:hypothetical protein